MEDQKRKRLWSDKRYGISFDAFAEEDGSHSILASIVFSSHKGISKAQLDHVPAFDLEQDLMRRMSREILRYMHAFIDKAEKEMQEEDAKRFAEFKPLPPLDKP